MFIEHIQEASRADHARILLHFEEVLQAARTEWARFVGYVQEQKTPIHLFSLSTGYHVEVAATIKVAEFIVTWLEKTPAALLPVAKSLVDYLLEILRHEERTTALDLARSPLGSIRAVALHALCVEWRRTIDNLVSYPQGKI